jgi:hypothetical protein
MSILWPAVIHKAKYGTEEALHESLVKMEIKKTSDG